ncbi:MAG TPA: TatD family hydrolase [Candidatus Limnocylindria bacterium]|nr:TatD family hydrolase [Candidatus Limnocylindria bacterium]
MGRRRVRVATHGGRGADLPPHGATGGRRLTASRAPGSIPGLVDSHCHLQDPAFDADRDAVIERARAVGVERILVPGWDVASSRAAVDLARRHAGLVQAAAGVHPHYAAAVSVTDWDELAVIAARPEVVAVGEIGLDFHRNLSPPDVQVAAFDRQLAMARQLGKPVLVHDREAHEAVSAALLDWTGSPDPQVRGVLHAFSGDAAMAARLSERGYLVSFALPVAFRSARGPRDAARALPDGAFLVETDSPWLAPGGREERNEPTTVVRVVAEVAKLRGASPQAVASGVRATYERLLGG